MAYVTCVQCSRHVRETESVCPFCTTARVATRQHMDFTELPSSLSRSALVLAGTLALAACNQVRQGNTESIVQPYGAPIPPQPPQPNNNNNTMAPAYGAPVPVELPMHTEVMDTGVVVTVDAAAQHTQPVRHQAQHQQQTTTPVAPPVAAYGAPAPNMDQQVQRNAPRYGAPPPPESDHYKDEA